MQFPLNCGDTFRLNTDVAHVWVVIAGPDDANRVVMVNFTTRRGNCDDTCVVQPGEHPNVTRDSVIAYAGAWVVNKYTLDQAIALHKGQTLAPVSPALLSRIQMGALASIYASPIVQSAVRKHLGI